MQTLVKRIFSELYLCKQFYPPPCIRRYEERERIAKNLSSLFVPLLFLILLTRYATLKIMQTLILIENKRSFFTQKDAGYCYISHKQNSHNQEPEMYHHIPGFCDFKHVLFTLLIFSISEIIILWRSMTTKGFYRRNSKQKKTYRSLLYKISLSVSKNRKLLQIETRTLMDNSLLRYRIL